METFVRSGIEWDITYFDCSESNSLSKIKFYDIHKFLPLAIVVDFTDNISIIDINARVKVWKGTSHTVYSVCSNSANLREKKRYSKKTDLTFDNLIAEFGISESKSSDSSIGWISRVFFLDSKSITTHSYCDKIKAPVFGRIALVCQNGIMFFNYMHNSGTILLNSDIKHSPTCMELITDEIIVIGSSDGTVSFWNCVSLKCLETLEFHGKSDIDVLMNLNCTLFSTPSSWSEMQAQRIPDKKFRFLSLGSDGNAFVWEGEIEADLINIDNKSPIARLDQPFGTMKSVLGSASAMSIGSLAAGSNTSASSTVSQNGNHGILHLGCNCNVFLNDAKSTITIVSSDHILRRFDLTRLSSLPRVSVSLTKSRPKLFSSFSSTDPYASLPTLQCQEKARMGTSISPFYHPHVLSKFMSVTPCEMFANATDLYVIAGKGSSIALVQMSSVSENESVHGDGGSSFGDDIRSTLRCVCEISIPHILNQYLTTVSPKENLVSALQLNNEAPNPQEHRISQLASSLKVFAVSSHPFLTNILLLSTSLGLMVIEDRTAQCGDTFGRHIDWSHHALCYADGYVREINPCIESERNICSVTQEVRMSDRDTGHFSKVYLENFHSSHRSSVATSHTANASNSPIPNKSSAFGVLDQCTTLWYDVIQYRPSFLVSPSGKFCCVLSSEMSFYVIYSTIHFSTSFASSAQPSPLVEIYRGTARSFAWIGMDDTFMTISPAVLAESQSSSSQPSRQSRRQSMSLNFLKKGPENDSNSNIKSIVPPQIEFIKIFNGENPVKLHIENMASELSRTTMSNQIDRLLVGIKGGVLLSAFFHNIKSAPREYNSTNSNSNNDSSSNEIKKVDDSYHVYAESRYPLKSQYVKFFFLQPVSSLESSSEYHYRLVSVGPVVAGFQNIAWDYSTFLCAIHMENTLNVLQLSIKKSLPSTSPNSSLKATSSDAANMSVSSTLKSKKTDVFDFEFKTIANVSCNQIIRGDRLNMYWLQGNLVVSSFYQTSIVFTNVHQTTINDNLAGMIVDVIHLSNGIQSYLDINDQIMPFRSFQPGMELCGCYNNNLTFINSFGSLNYVVPIDTSPSLLILVLLSLEDTKARKLSLKLCLSSQIKASSWPRLLSWLEKLGYVHEKEQLERFFSHSL